MKILALSLLHVFKVMSFGYGVISPVSKSKPKYKALVTANNISQQSPRTRSLVLHAILERK